MGGSEAEVKGKNGICAFRSEIRGLGWKVGRWEGKRAEWFLA
jgi:hypothetical protein